MKHREDDEYNIARLKYVCNPDYTLLTFNVLGCCFSAIMCFRLRSSSARLLYSIWFVHSVDCCVFWWSKRIFWIMSKWRNSISCVHSWWRTNIEWAWSFWFPSFSISCNNSWKARVEGRSSFDFEDDHCQGRRNVSPPTVFLIITLNLDDLFSTRTDSPRFKPFALLVGKHVGALIYKETYGEGNHVKLAKAHTSGTF